MRGSSANNPVKYRKEILFENKQFQPPNEGFQPGAPITVMRSNVACCL